MTTDNFTAPATTANRSAWGRWLLLGLALMFIGPKIAAWSLYTVHPAWLGTQINNGQLLEPPLNFNQLSLTSANAATKLADLESHWIMLYVAPSPCTKSCQANLYTLRQVRIATGKDRDRVKRLLVTLPGQTAELNAAINAEFAGTDYATVTQAALTHFFGKVKFEKFTLQQGGLFLVDPLGNLMMAYPADVPAKRLLQDLSRLLRTSKIG